MTEQNESSVPQTPGWMAQLPDDLKSHETLTQFKNVGDLGKAFLDADGRLSKSVPLLTEDATEEQKAEFYQKLGRPETPDKYDLTADDVEPEALSGWKQRFHAAGLTQAQARALFDAYREQAKAQADAQQKALTKAQEALKTDWGDQYDANIELARRAVVQFGGDELKAFLDESGLGNDLRMVKAFAAIGKAVAEDVAVLGKETGERKELESDGLLSYPNSPKLKRRA